MTLTSWLSAWPAVGPLGDHLWQSTLFAVAAALLVLALRRNRAHVRYWLWLAASVKFLVPFAALVSIGNQFGWLSSARIVQPALTLVVDAMSQPFSQASIRVTSGISTAADARGLGPGDWGAAAGLIVLAGLAAVWLADPRTSCRIVNFSRIR